MTVPYSNSGAERARDLALQMVLEWITHPDFKARVSGKAFINSVTIGRTFIEIGEATNHNTYDETYTNAKRRWQDALKEAQNLGWLHVDNRTIGRPREKEYDRHERALAERRLRFMQPHHLENRDNCITGGPSTTSTAIVTIQDHIWRDLLSDITAEALSGNSRSDIGDAFGLPDRSTRAFWRWLVRHGWRQKRIRHADGSRTYVIVQEGDQ